MSFFVRLKKIQDFWNKTRVFFNPNSANYWHKITPCYIREKPNEINRYYLDFSSKINYAQNFDENRVPLFKYLDEIPETYHPIAISQYALGLYDILVQSDFKDDEIKNKFMIQANWLKNNCTIKNGGAFWYFNYPDARYNIQPPWCSAMAQGEAVSVLCRAFKLTNNEEYLKSADSALKAFFINVKDGGVINYFENIILYEEFPAGEVTGVLNGFIFSLFGLYDLILINKNANAIELFNNGITAVKNLLPYYDLGYWSRYDLFRYPLENPASFTYHSLHVEQLKALYILTGEKIFNDYSGKWSAYSERLSNRVKALVRKIFYLKKMKAI